jgi:hypothetical protein
MNSDNLKRRSSYVIPHPLKNFRRRGASQNDESGVIDAIVSAIPMRRRFFVEFGIGPNYHDPDYSRGLEGNCVDLATKGWDGLFMDGGAHPPQYGVKQEFITAGNINDLLRKYEVPPDFSLISIDVDGQDLWIWQALSYAPELAVIEYNPNFGPSDSLSAPIDHDFRWDGTKYYGASLAAQNKIARSKGYHLVYANGVNAFFIKRHLIKNLSDFKFEEIFVRRDEHQIDAAARKIVQI